MYVCTLQVKLRRDEHKKDILFLCTDQAFQRYGNARLRIKALASSTVG